MPEILITPAAENDLVDIWAWIARDNREAADRVYAAVGQTCVALAAMPAMGTAYRAKRPRLNGIRFFPVKQFRTYVIYYRETPAGIEIIRVLHAHMNARKRLARGAAT